MRVLLIAIALSLASAFAQPNVIPLTGGVIALRPVPGVGGLVALNFELYGELAAKIGSNWFQYNADSFTLNFTSDVSPIFCKSTCTYNGTIETWYTPQGISKYCSIYSGIINGTLVTDAAAYENVPADYSQVFCHDHGNWWSGGSLSIHLLD